MWADGCGCVPAKLCIEQAVCRVCPWDVVCSLFPESPGLPCRSFTVLFFLFLIFFSLLRSFQYFFFCVACFSFNIYTIFILYWYFNGVFGGMELNMCQMGHVYLEIYYCCLFRWFSICLFLVKPYSYVSRAEVNPEVLWLAWVYGSVVRGASDALLTLGLRHSHSLKWFG